MVKKEDELALKVTKEIIIKFIEVGRLSINSFEEGFTQIYETVRDTLVRVDLEEAGEDQETGGSS